MSFSDSRFRRNGQCCNLAMTTNSYTLIWPLICKPSSTYWSNGWLLKHVIIITSSWLMELFDWRAGSPNLLKTQEYFDHQSSWNTCIQQYLTIYNIVLADIWSLPWRPRKCLLYSQIMLWICLGQLSTIACWECIDSIASHLAGIGISNMVHVKSGVVVFGKKCIQVMIDNLRLSILFPKLERAKNTQWLWISTHLYDIDAFRSCSWPKPPQT